MWYRLFESLNKNGFFSDCEIIDKKSDTSEKQIEPSKTAAGCNVQENTEYTTNQDRIQDVACKYDQKLCPSNDVPCIRAADLTNQRKTETIQFSPQYGISVDAETNAKKAKEIVNTAANNATQYGIQHRIQLSCQRYSHKLLCTAPAEDSTLSHRMLFVV